MDMAVKGFVMLAVFVHGCIAPFLIVAVVRLASDEHANTSRTRFI